MSASIGTTGYGAHIGFKVNLVGDAKLLVDPTRLSKFLKESLQEGEDVAHSKCPYDTGYLDSTIGHQVNGLKGSLYATADYAEPVEMGHRTRGGSFVSAQPFIRPAADHVMDVFEQKVQQEARTKRFSP